jgi:2'-5' RNA ligase
VTETPAALGWQYDTSSSRYRSQDGRYVSSDTIRQLRNDFLDAQALKTAQLAAAVSSGSVSVGEWEASMREVVQTTLGVEYVFGRGGLDQMTADDWDAVGALVADQFGYLNGFASAIADGDLNEAQIAARSDLYIGSGIGAYERGAASATDVELPVYPGDDCEGGNNCRCSWELEPTDGGGLEATWVAEDDDRTCDVCSAHAQEWSPLELSPEEVNKSMPHEFGSTQLNLPEDIAAAVSRYQARRIASVDLAPGDLETQPHITVAFGVPASTSADDVARALAGCPPTIAVTFGQLATFAAGDDGVPLYIEVDSPDLDRLHAQLVEALGITDTHATYTPHVTVAYIQPGSEPVYLSDQSPLQNRTAIFHAVTFSDPERNQTDIALTGGAQLLTKELLRAEIAKIDDDQQIVFGWASVSVGKDGELLVDRQDDVIFPEDLEHAAYDFVLNSRQADTSHDEVTKAHLVESVVFTAEKLEKMGLAFVTPEGELKKSDAQLCMWWSGFFVPSPDVWAGIRKGDFAAFSIGGFAVREPMEATS